MSKQLFRFHYIIIFLLLAWCGRLLADGPAVTVDSVDTMNSTEVADADDDEDDGDLVPEESENEGSKKPLLNRDILDESLSLGQHFLLINQRPEGNFIYDYDLDKEDVTANENQVRQAGALWGLTLMYRDEPTVLLRDAARKGFAFYAKNSKWDDKRGRYVVYPDNQHGRTGTNALVILSLLEMLESGKALPEIERNVYYEFLRQYLPFLLTLRRTDGRFLPIYDYNKGIGRGRPSPYFDGESLLALVRSARYFKDDKLKSLALESAETMRRIYAEEAIQNDDRDLTKGFFQWGCMAFYEIADAGWDEEQTYAKAAVDMGYWIVNRHKILRRTRNTAYAMEGLLFAYKCADILQDPQAKLCFVLTVDRGLYKLSSWQIGSELENNYLSQHKFRNPVMIGGILSGPGDPLIRIDTVQHQMHAVILARELIYRKRIAATDK